LAAMAAIASDAIARSETDVLFTVTVLIV